MHSVTGILLDLTVDHFYAIKQLQIFFSKAVHM